MNIITFTDARANLKQTLDFVCHNHEPTIITRQNGEPVVLLSLDDYNSTQETMHLLSSPNNANRLAESIAQLRSGAAKVRDIGIGDDESI